MNKLVALVFVLASLGGCVGSGNIGGASSVQVLSGTELPAPDRTDLLSDSRPYLIGPFDKLKIDVFGIDELSKKEVQTDASGRISFPLAGVIEAAGRTPNHEPAGYEPTFREALYIPRLFGIGCARAGRWRT